MPSITSLRMNAPTPPIGPTQEAPALPISPVIVSTATIENVSCENIWLGDKNINYR